MKIRIPIEPVATPRPRVARNGGVFYPAKYTQYKKDLAMLVRNNPTEPILGAVELKVIFYLQIPKSTSKKLTEKLNGSYHTKKPDTDNLIKGIKDEILEKKGYVKNDSQIAKEFIEKKWTSGEPSINIEILEL